MSAQSTVKEGKVIDANNGSPHNLGAFVFVDNIPINSTDENGVFRINPSVLDSFLLTIKFVGYKTFTQNYPKNIAGIITIR
ncbi:MAG: carboxypeptidase-like regulatory domain-containing protein [Saprospiraceae bacterium]|nr:carboxypeptidase-like regulatory domain-containing protein [Saprospiraceae bacterium]